MNNNRRQMPLQVLIHPTTVIERDYLGLNVPHGKSHCRSTAGSAAGSSLEQLITRGKFRRTTAGRGVARRY
jgi:hypothetical protein